MSSSCCASSTSVSAPLPVVAESLRLAAIQMRVLPDKAANLVTMAAKVKEAATTHHAKLVILPEMFNCPIAHEFFPAFAEPEDGETAKALQTAAKENGVYLIGGSFPEREGDRVYNTTLIFNPDGVQVAKYRKMHLFDIDIPGKMTFQESKTISSGNSFATLDIPEFGFRIGVAICFDIRFPEEALLYVLNHGCNMLVYPAAFNLTTGPRHWTLLARARAVDCQVYTVLASPSRDHESKYVAYGHSMVVNPWGEITAEAEEAETIITADVSSALVHEVRQSVPSLSAKRRDVYKVVKL